jgi:hypothetical protein
VLHISEAFGPQSLDWGDRIRGYSYTLAFLASHGEIDNEAPSSGLAKWIWGDRKFFTGGRYLEDHARALNTRVFSHALFFCGYLMWYKAMVLSSNRYFDPMLGLTETDIRLMCLDNTKTSIGWAANQARLRDEVFLILGCNRPVILRKNQEGRYTVAGKLWYPKLGTVACGMTIRAGEDGTP